VETTIPRFPADTGTADTGTPHPNISLALLCALNLAENMENSDKEEEEESSCIKAEFACSEKEPENVLESGANEAEGASTNLSKKEKKRLLVQEYRRANKKAKKENEKQVRLEARKARLENMPSTEQEERRERDPNSKNKKERKVEEAIQFKEKTAKTFSIIIDCDWESKHSEQTLKSLTQQIMFCYGINRRHDNPASLYLTGVGPLVTANLSKSNFQHWIGTTIESKDYIDLPYFSVTSQTAPAHGEAAPDAAEVTGNDNGTCPTKVKTLVYLTSDAEETIETLDPNCAYIIGGIVDRNKFKGATYNKAVAQGVRTAKLPIKENFDLGATHILTVNHVYGILLNFAKYQDWRQAIKEVLPSRKCVVEKDATGGDNGANDAGDVDDTKDNDTDNADGAKGADGACEGANKATVVVSVAVVDGSDGASANSN
jgi:tRNA (guanine9-N1)-methyltransferase